MGKWRTHDENSNSGAGNVGNALGQAWARAGHEIIFGVQMPNGPQMRTLVAGMPSGTRVSVINVKAAARDSEVVVLAVPWSAVPSVLRECGEGLAGKLLIDVTNPLKPDFSGLEDDYRVSGAERVAGWAPSASVFKASNQTGSENMADPTGYAAVTGSIRPVMFACGNDAARKPDMLRLIEDAGFEAVDAGGLESARLLEPFGMLWIRLAHAQGLGRSFAFGLLRRPNGHGATSGS